MKKSITLILLIAGTINSIPMEDLPSVSKYNCNGCLLCQDLKTRMLETCEEKSASEVVSMIKSEKFNTNIPYYEGIIQRGESPEKIIYAQHVLNLIEAIKKDVAAWEQEKSQ